MITKNDIKLGDRFSVAPVYEVEVIYVTDRGFLVRFGDGSESYKSFKWTDDWSHWVKIKPMTKKKVFFYIYKQYPDRIYTYTDCSQFYATPTSIEYSHKLMKEGSAILWVSEIHEIVFETPEVK